MSADRAAESAVHDGALRLWTDQLGPGDRVLISGASGWFGRTAAVLTIAGAAARGATMLGIASEAKTVTAGGFPVDCVAWDDQAIAEFAPTVVIDCAFLTRDRVADLPLEDYVARNRGLNASLYWAAALPSVRRVVTISSGAAVHPHDALDGPLEANPYGYLKREAEQELERVVARTGVAVVVARAWSVSGALVLKPRSYALSDMILQARGGAIRITASARVFRRYVAVEDLLAVSLASARPGIYSVLDSGGPLVEMSDLAEAVADVVMPRPEISRVELTDSAPNDYHSDGAAWSEACRRLEFTPADLHAQLETVQASLVG